jgi:hypothetical protein
MARYALILIKWVHRALRVRRPRLFRPALLRGLAKERRKEAPNSLSKRNLAKKASSILWKTDSALGCLRPDFHFVGRRIRTIGKPPLAALLSPDGFFARWQTLGATPEPTRVEGLKRTPAGWLTPSEGFFGPSAIVRELHAAAANSSKSNH